MHKPVAAIMCCWVNMRLIREKWRLKTIESGGIRQPRILQLTRTRLIQIGRTELPFSVVAARVRIVQTTVPVHPMSLRPRSRMMCAIWR